MNVSCARIAALLATLVMSSATLDAHRLDECLQAARIRLEENAVRVEIDIMPGAAVADHLLSEIDRDGSGRLDARETASYAARVASDLQVVVDNRSLPLTLSARSVSEPDELRAGVGHIRLEGAARMAGRSGHHRLFFENRSEPTMTVYMANVLMPETPRVRLASPQRDEWQRTLTIEYDVASRSNGGMVWPLSAAAVLGTLVVGRRGSSRWRRWISDQFTRTLKGLKPVRRL